MELQVVLEQQHILLQHLSATLEKGSVQQEHVLAGIPTHGSADKHLVGAVSKVEITSLEVAVQQEAVVKGPDILSINGLPELS